MTSRELAIVRSVIYASLFDYPLTLDQLHESLIESDQTPSEILAVYEGSEILQTIIDHRDGFFFPAGRVDLIAGRRRRGSRSRVFLDRHGLLLRLICGLPFTRMVALSGSIAHLNLEADGDLDLFIVTRGRRVWTVTVAVLVLTRLMRQRRIVCANFVLADSHLVLEQQDLFTANQVLHLKPLVGGDVLPEFFEANPFVERFYPNALAWRQSPLPGLGRHRPLAVLKAAVELLLIAPSPLFEAVCRRLYGWHLKRRAGSWESPEQVRLQYDYLKLHTRSHRQSVLARLECTVGRELHRAERACNKRAVVGGRR